MTVTEVLIRCQARVSADRMRSLCDTATYLSHCSTGTPCQILNFGGNNHKYSPAHLVTIDYGDTDRVHTPTDFPSVVSEVRGTAASLTRPTRAPAGPRRQGRLLDPVERAGQYLARVPPAIAGEHGDVHTFRVCCRLVRGFALEDHEALTVLAEWNGRCQPPWSEPELRDKLRRARRYGREPIGGLLDTPATSPR